MKRLFVQVHSETQILFGVASGVASGIASEQKKITPLLNTVLLKYDKIRLK